MTPTSDTILTGSVVRDLSIADREKKFFFQTVIHPIYLETPVIARTPLKCGHRDLCPTIFTGGKTRKGKEP
jgi:hypothetical protein